MRATDSTTLTPLDGAALAALARALWAEWDDATFDEDGAALDPRTGRPGAAGALGGRLRLMEGRHRRAGTRYRLEPPPAPAGVGDDRPRPEVLLLGLVDDAGEALVFDIDDERGHFPTRLTIARDHPWRIEASGRVHVAGILAEASSRRGCGSVLVSLLVGRQVTWSTWGELAAAAGGGTVLDASGRLRGAQGTCELVGERIGVRRLRVTSTAAASGRGVGRAIWWVAKRPLRRALTGVVRAGLDDAAWNRPRDLLAEVADGDAVSVARRLVWEVPPVRDEDPDEPPHDRRRPDR